VDTLTRELKEVDRAVLDGEERGFVRVHVKKGTDNILGATIVARHAGEMINEISLAINAGLGLKDIANVIHPYPTQAEAIRQVADMYNRTRLTEPVKRAFSLWLALSRIHLPALPERYRSGMNNTLSRICGFLTGNMTWRSFLTCIFRYLH